MQKYANVVQNRLGRAISGASVLVTLASNGAVADLFSDNGITPTDNPLTTNNLGHFAFYAADGRYNIQVSVGSTVLATETDILLEDPADGSAALAANTGAALVGSILTGTGAVKRTLQETGRDHLNGAGYGMIADWNGSAGTNNAPKLLNALTELKTRGGGILTINPGDYYLGAYSTSALVTLITDLKNALIYAYGVRFIINTTALATPFMLVFDSPNNVTFAGATFTDIGFDPARWGTANDRWGAVAVLLMGTNVSSGFRMVDCHAESMSTLLLSDLRTTKRNLKNIAVEDCTCKTTYYGVNVLYVGDNLKVDNLVCQDVRRGVIGYGMRNFDIDAKLYTTSGFLGSNAFISLACEGETYNDGNGVLGAEGNVRNGRVKLNVSGYEAHAAYVHFYHQQADSVGDISNIQSNVLVNNLSSAGKNPLIGPTNIYLIDHELPSTATQDPTQRTCKQLALDGGIIGSITGVPVVVNSSNTSSPHTLALSPNLTRLAHTYTINLFTYNSDFLSPFERTLDSLIPVGATTSGVVTGLVCQGTWCQIGKRIFFNVSMSWTGHTGTGQLRINGLPKPLDTSRGAFASASIAVAGLAHTAGTSLTALIGGTGNNQILIYEDNAGGLNTVAVDPSVGNFIISGSYVTP